MYFDTDDEYLYLSDDVHSEIKIGAKIISLPIDIGILSLFLTSYYSIEVKYICYYSGKKYGDKQIIYFNTGDEHSHPSNNASLVSKEKYFC